MNNKHQICMPNYAVITQLPSCGEKKSYILCL